MLDRIKYNSNGHAEILELICWLDGGTVTVNLDTIDNNPIRVTLNQRVDLRVSERNPHPGRLLVDKQKIEMRSELETEILTILKTAEYSSKFTEDKYFYSNLLDSIKFVESKEYLDLPSIDLK